jgi:hypothetical protein
MGSRGSIEFSWAAINLVERYKDPAGTIRERAASGALGPECAASGALGAQAAGFGG